MKKRETIEKEKEVSGERGRNSNNDIFKLAVLCVTLSVCVSVSADRFWSSLVCVCLQEEEEVAVRRRIINRVIIIKYNNYTEGRGEETVQQKFSNGSSRRRRKKMCAQSEEEVSAASTAAAAEKICLSVQSVCVL